MEERKGGHHKKITELSYCSNWEIEYYLSKV